MRAGDRVRTTEPFGSKTPEGVMTGFGEGRCVPIPGGLGYVIPVQFTDDAGCRWEFSPTELEVVE